MKRERNDGRFWSSPSYNNSSVTETSDPSLVFSQFTFIRRTKLRTHKKHVETNLGFDKNDFSPGKCQRRNSSPQILNKKYYSVFSFLSPPKLFSCSHFCIIIFLLLLSCSTTNNGSALASPNEGGRLTTTHSSQSSSELPAPPPPPCWSGKCKIEIIEEDISSSSALEVVSTSPELKKLLSEDSASSGNSLSLHAAPTPVRDTKVSCRGLNSVTRLDQLCLQQLPSTTKFLEISNSTISRLPSSGFSSLVHLRKLDLRYNRISLIEPFAFEGLSNLKRLDLSFNRVASLNSSQLEGLSEVIRFKIGHNPLKHIEDNIQDAMPSLRALELANTLLDCDCHLSWLVENQEDADTYHPVDAAGQQEHKKRRPIRLLGSPTCQWPDNLRGTKLRKISPDFMICRDELPSVSMMELEPGIDQVVFAGDSLRLSCKVSVSRDSSNKRVWWQKGQSHYKEDSEEVTVKTVSNDGRVESYVDIPSLHWGHSGEWRCIVEAKSGNNSKSVSVYVIHHGTKYCPLNMTIGTKGRYSWPRTVAAVSVDLPCEGSNPGSLKPLKHATHNCDQNGQWEFLDLSQCSYVSENTRILEHFATTNLSSSNVIESARALKNFTSGQILRDPVDVYFLETTLRQYSRMVANNINYHAAAQVLVDIISTALSSTKDLLASSEYLTGSCNNLLKNLWFLCDHVPTLTGAATPHLNIHQVTVQPHSFTGISCVWFRKSTHHTERQFRCNSNNYSALFAIEDDVTDARIRIPGSLFHKKKILNPSGSNSSTSSKNRRSTSSRNYRLQFFAFDSAKLFPSKRTDSWRITSPVVGVRIVSEEHVNESEEEEALKPEDTEVYITLRSAIYSHNVEPGIWKASNRSQTFGHWKTDGCQILQFVNSLIVFKCQGLSHFGLLQDMQSIQGHRVLEGKQFTPSEPAVYVGSFICCVLLMASIATWGIHYNQIVTTNKNKHSFINTWIALLFLVSLFTVGVHQTENIVTCQVIGIVMHYLSTCVLLWLIVSVTNLYKRTNKVLRPPLPTEDSMPDDPPPPKPILRFYLVGWGISLILCGISAAVNLPHYRTISYCFLAWNPSMAAFYAPCAALVFILAAFFLLTQCILRNSYGGYSEATGGNTETTELELLDTASPTSGGGHCSRDDDELSLASQSSGLSLTDAQQSPTTQLRAHAVTLILFLLTWASAAITTASPFNDVIPFHGTIFSILYAVCAISLGLFIFIYYCVNRSDAIDAWKDFFYHCSSNAKEEDETILTAVANNASSTTFLSPPSSQQSPPQNNNLLAPPASAPSSLMAPSLHSVDSTHTHPTTKSSHHSIQNKIEIAKTSNALHMLTTMQDSVQFAPEMFYNPKQAGVARRFFQKQRLKQMMKQNNLEVNRVDSDCNSSTVYKPRSSNLLQQRSASDVSAFNSSYFALSNKINNTNIHVDSMYNENKHSAKSLTPELLCVLGPSSKDPCDIVSSMENDQYQWPIAMQHQCSNPVYFQPKHLNLPRSPNSSISGIQTHDTQSISPVPKLSKPYGSRNFRGKLPVNRPRRKKLMEKSGNGGASFGDPFEWSEEERSTQSLEYTDHMLKLTGQSLEASPMPAGMPPLNLSRQSTSPASVMLVNPYATTGVSPCNREMEWLHLIQKRSAFNESQNSFEESQRNSMDDSSNVYFDDLGGSEEDESDNGVGVAAVCKTWEKELQGRVNENLHEDFFPEEEEDDLCSEDDGRSSVGTSLVPEVDPSPPPSLPVSDSPFDSPMHRFHENTPDTMSIESIGLELTNAGMPTLTLTASTPVNTPVSVSSPEGSSPESPDTIQQNSFMNSFQSAVEGLSYEKQGLLLESESMNALSEEQNEDETTDQIAETFDLSSEAINTSANPHTPPKEDEDSKSSSSKETDV